jgi:hypothetical protein
VGLARSSFLFIKLNLARNQNSLPLPLLPRRLRTLNPKPPEPLPPPKRPLIPQTLTIMMGRNGKRRKSSRRLSSLLRGSTHGGLGLGGIVTTAPATRRAPRLSRTKGTLQFWSVGVVRTKVCVNSCCGTWGF